MPVDELGVDGGGAVRRHHAAARSRWASSLEIQPDVGPVIHEPIRSAADVERLRPLEPEEGVPFVLEAIRHVRRELGRTARRSSASAARRSRWPAT